MASARDIKAEYNALRSTFANLLPQLMLALETAKVPADVSADVQLGFMHGVAGLLQRQRTRFGSPVRGGDIEEQLCLDGE